MHPVICQIGPFSIYSYGLMLAVAFLICSALANIQAKKQNINPNIIFNFLFITFIFGIIGSRAFYVIENFTYYLKNPLEIIMLQRGGLSWYGGLILGGSSGILYLKKKNLGVYRVLDLVIPFLALAQAIGRIGCLLNGCCFGKASSFGLYFEAEDAVLIPTQLYSSLILILIFIILRFSQDRPHKDGLIFYLYLSLYSSKRFFIEFLRADNPVIMYGLTLFQIISIALFLFSILMLISITCSRK